MPNTKFHSVISTQTTGGTNHLFRILKVYSEVLHVNSHVPIRILFRSGDKEATVMRKIGREMDLLLKTTGFDLRTHCKFYLEDFTQDDPIEVQL